MATAKSVLGRAKVDYSCEQCGKDFHATIHEITKADTINCPHCGGVYGASDPMAHMAIKEAKKLDSELRKISKIKI